MTHSRNPITLLAAVAVAMLGSPFLAGCAHHLGPELESPRMVRELGFAECQITEPMRRYEALDYADRMGDPNLEDSREWSKAIAMMQPGDDLRYVYCKNGRNFFGLFRGTSLLLQFGGMIFD